MTDLKKIKDFRLQLIDICKLAIKATATAKYWCYLSNSKMPDEILKKEKELLIFINRLENAYGLEQLEHLAKEMEAK